MILVFLIFLNAIHGSSLNCFKVNVENKGKVYVYPKIVWSYWSNVSEIPEDIEEMMSITKDSLRNFSYNLITENNITDFLNVSEFPSYYPHVSTLGQSDYIRVCLLEKYGGIWVDASTYITSSSTMERFFLEALQSRKQVYGFGNIEPKHILLNFFGAIENSEFMKKFKEAYYEALSGDGVDYCEKTLCPYIRRIAKARWRCEFYYCNDNLFLKVVYENPILHADLLYMPVSRSQYQLKEECRGRGRYECMKHRLQYDPEARKIPFIKLEHRVRLGKRMNFTEPLLLNGTYVWPQFEKPRTKKIINGTKIEKRKNKKIVNDTEKIVTNSSKNISQEL